MSYYYRTTKGHVDMEFLDAAQRSAWERLCVADANNRPKGLVDALRGYVACDGPDVYFTKNKDDGNIFAALQCRIDVLTRFEVLLQASLRWCAFDLAEPDAWHADVAPST